MSIQSEIDRLQGVKSGIKNAIVESGIDVPDDTPFTEYANKTSQIVGQFDAKMDEIIGGEIVPMLDVQQRLEAINGVSGDVSTQLDTLDSTKAAISAAITEKGVEVPEGTTFQEYAEKIGKIGDLIIPNPPQDGKTRLYITIPAPCTISLYLWFMRPNTVEINWGDGSDAETNTATMYTTISHTYANPGDFIIELTPLTNSVSIQFGNSDGTLNVFGNDIDSDNAYSNILQYLILSDCAPLLKGFMNNTKLKYVKFVTTSNDAVPERMFSDYAFSRCYSLQGIDMTNITLRYNGIKDNAFAKCISMKDFVVPSEVTDIGAFAFANCSSLQSLTLENGVENIGAYAFYSTSLLNVTLPQGVMNIGNYAFSDCLLLDSVYVEATTPPTLGTHVFDEHGESFTIYVPPESVDAYKQAAGWSEYADFIMAKP